jgi:GNAT superfamily N-acetyltransferase
MDGQFILKPMDTNSLDDVLRLLGRESSPEMRKYYIWKYEETPANQLGVVIDSDSSRVIGFNALTRSSIIFERNIYDTVQSIDLIVHPEFRKQGIRPLLCSSLYEKCKENGFTLAIGWTARHGPAWSGFEDKLGWIDIGLMPVLAYPIRPFRAVRWLEWGRFRSLIAGAFLWLRKLVKHPKKVKSDELVIDKSAWDHNELWRCWRESLKPGAAAVNRTPDFYRRRFSKSMWPPHEFIPISAWKNDKIVCFAICITHVLDGGTEGIIVDLHAIDGADDALRLVVEKCVEHFESQGADYIRLWGKKPEWVVKQFVDDGFILRNRTQCFRLLSLSERNKIDPRLYDFGLWDLDLCDSDHV